MQGIQETTAAHLAEPTVISSEDLKALLYLTIRGRNTLAPREEAQHLDAENGVDVKA